MNQCPTCGGIEYRSATPDDPREREATTGDELLRPAHARVLDALLPLDLDRECGPDDPFLSVGKDNYSIDQEMVADIDRCAPGFGASVRAGHVFQLRAVAALAERGVCQFVVIGCGYPRERNVGSVARSIISVASVLYLDDGSIVSAYGLALLDTETRYLRADLDDPYSILAAIEHTRLRPGGIDPSGPVALVFGSLVLERLTDPAAVIAELVAAFPSGYLAATHVCTDADTDPDTLASVATVYTEYHLRMRPRLTAEVTALLAGSNCSTPA
ncbi:SAM-dependent methyltransferase [Nocardia sp. NPDC005366]|uniref:SAM-dependent methyltransferase n=1 Tax=Nocardia sp. NPDC005366 TaxID=3156878 RepID=UPI0033A6E95A